MCGQRKEKTWKSRFATVATKLLTKVSKTYISEKTTSSRNHAGKLGIHMQEKKTDPSLSLSRKINSKLLKNPKNKVLIMVVVMMMMTLKKSFESARRKTQRRYFEERKFAKNSGDNRDDPKNWQMGAAHSTVCAQSRSHHHSGEMVYRADLC